MSKAGTVSKEGNQTNPPEIKRNNTVFAWFPRDWSEKEKRRKVFLANKINP